MTSYPALRELAEKAVSGPWHNVDSVVVSDTRHEDTYSYGDTTPDRKAVAYCGDEIRHRMGLPFGDERDNNANFIAAANPTAILDILDKYDAALAEIDRLKEALKPFADVGEIVLAEAPQGAVAVSFQGVEGRHIITLDAFRAASQALRSTP